MLLAGAATSSVGVIDQVALTRDSNGHITGFSGPATPFAAAPSIDGGLAFGPGGVLFYTTWPGNKIGEIKPGSGSANKMVNAPVPSSTGTLGFVPAGFQGEGNLIVGSYTTSTLCVAPLTADGNGTFDVGACGASVIEGGGAEGLVWVPQGSTLFPNQSVLLSSYGSGKVFSYKIDSNGLPIPATRQDFVQNAAGIEGAAIDPVSGDFVFSTFGGSNHMLVVRGFESAAVGAPEPGAEALIGIGLTAIAVLARRRRGIRK
jgi:hypothetical protein